jgi:predicted permease
MNNTSYLFKQAWASLKGRPAFVSAVVVTMGTTLGALLCILTLAYLLILQPLPYPEQDKLYNVAHSVSNKTHETNVEAFSYPGLIHLYKNQDVFEQAALIDYGQDVLTSLPNQPTLKTGYVTPEWFELLDAPMLMGRMFEATEALDTFNPVAILSYQAWQKEFSARPDILDSKVTFSGVSYRVIGVLAKNFIEPQLKTTGLTNDIWFPWDYNLHRRVKDRWDNVSFSLTMVGKLKGSFSPVQAGQVMTPLVNDIWVENVASMAFFNGWSVQMELQSLQGVVLGDSQNTVYLLLAGVFGLVLIAFANIANLFMSRTAEQQRQLAIYAALGAKKSHLFKALLAESSLLMLMSILLALAIASCGFYILQTHLVLVLPRVSELGINLFTLASAVFFAGVFALLFAFLSSKLINYRALNSILQSSGKGTGVQVSKRFRQALIVSQVAIATALVFANISLFREAVDTIAKPTGFQVDNQWQIGLSVSAPERPPVEEMMPVMQELKKKLIELPQVEEISQSGSVMSGFSVWAITAVASNENFTPNSKEVSANYFSLIGQTLLEGDYFNSADIRDNNRVMIVNDVFAKHLNPQGSVLGMQMSRGEPQTWTIVGVVKGVLIPAESEIPLRVYSPSDLANTQMTLKLKAGQTISREEVVNVINSVSNQYALFSLESVHDLQQKKLFTQYTTAITTAVLAIITLFLASIGLYGILSYGTQMRRFELGTRMALGAKRQQLISLIVKDNVWVIALGIVSSVLVMLVLYIAYQAELAPYLGLGLVVIFAITVFAIGSLSLFACYWPLRQFINQPAIHSLRGSD